MSDENFISKLWQDTLQTALDRRATDIHVEPGEYSTLIRIRIDGTLFAYHQFNSSWHNQLVSHIKILANLDIGEKRLPQDGRYVFIDSSHSNQSRNHRKGIDCRVSSLPTIWGEKIVVRVLNRSLKQPALEELHFDPWQLNKLERALNSPQGLIIITGPTGSGKTMTLFSCLQYLNNGHRNISTVEDPVEVNLPGINQIAIHTQAGLHYAVALRALLRQDPDVIMIGEIRDSETAQIALQAAQTGHLVLASLHTNNTVSSIHRFLHLGCELDVLANCLLLITAQRLVRVFCHACQSAPSSPMHHCKICMGSGFFGRQAIHEIMPFPQTIREMVLKRASALELLSTSQMNGMRTLRENALELVKLNITSLDEIDQQIGNA